MWENIQFSARIVLPSFVMIFLGRLITLKGLASPAQMDRVGKLTFTYLLSTKIFLDIVDSDLSGLSGGGLVSFCMLASTATFALAWALAGKLLRRKESVGSFTQSCFRCSFTVLGLSMVETFAGSEGVAKAAPLLAGAVILFNVLASIVLASPEASPSPGAALKKTARSIAANPLIVAVVLGLAVALSGVELPYLVRNPAQQLGGMAAPLSLLCIGSSLDMQKVRRSFRYALAASCVKAWGQALVFLPIAALCGFRDYELTVIAIYLTAANPSANYVMTLATGHDSDLAASAIVLSTLMSVFSSMAAITVLRALGLI